ncbi:hypothetical protein AB0F88_39850 [Streptosporangium sp. NPDC023963]|uniref:hypothetical protein n=1 Tax=Streptosporangium sp. NPDC023963 TaxID=3155608 RepID=UPI0034328227
MSAVDIFGTSTSVARYRVQMQVLDKIVGGVPSSPSVIKGWLKSRMDIGDRDLQELVDKTLAERFPNGQPSADALAEALMDSEAAPNINGFKRIPGSGELAYETRCMKAAIKEWANSAYPGTDWDDKFTRKPAVGRPLPKGFRKGLMSTSSERVFITKPYIGLGVTEPTGVEERIKHVMTAQGPRSSINRVEYVECPLLEFELKVHDDFLSNEAWGRIWERGEDIGIGSDRGRSDGKFELLAFDRMP